MKESIAFVLMATSLYGALFQANRNLNTFAGPDKPNNALDLLLRLTPTYWVGRVLVLPFGGKQ